MGTHRSHLEQIPDVKEEKLQISVALQKVFMHPHIIARLSTDA
jgi:hypothetical protein